jgi:hypothetical protein
MNHPIHHYLWLVLLAATSLAANTKAKPTAEITSPLAEPNEIQRWTKSMNALNGLAKANWRDFLQSITDHTLKTGASFDEHRTLALTRIEEVARKEALDEVD